MYNLQTKPMTRIISNGSKWNGQKPDSINKLIDVLAKHPIDEDFFSKEKDVRLFGVAYKWVVLCPISKEDGVYTFFGNFEDISHIFNIKSTDRAVIAKLKKAIMDNAGWKKYICNLKRKAD